MLAVIAFAIVGVAGFVNPALCAVIITALIVRVMHTGVTVGDPAELEAALAACEKKFGSTARISNLYLVRHTRSEQVHE